MFNSWGPARSRAKGSRQEIVASSLPRCSKEGSVRRAVRSGATKTSRGSPWLPRQGLQQRREQFTLAMLCDPGDAVLREDGPAFPFPGHQSSPECRCPSRDPEARGRHPQRSSLRRSLTLGDTSVGFPLPLSHFLPKLKGPNLS